MANMYRKSLLERMSSPEQLDKMVEITSPGVWMAIIGGGIICVAVILWSIFAWLPVKIESTGLYVSDQTNIVRCYIPISTGKKVTKGMEVIVYPTTVNKQEYGHMVATVEAVDDYIATASSITEQLDDENLANSILQNGSVVCATCRLKEDKSTASGFYWSSKTGASVELKRGTPVIADVIVEKKHPITMIIPLLKEKMSTITQPQQNQTQ